MIRPSLLTTTTTPPALVSVNAPSVKISTSTVFMGRPLEKLSFITEKRRLQTIVVVISSVSASATPSFERNSDTKIGDFSC